MSKHKHRILLAIVAPLFFWGCGSSVKPGQDFQSVNDGAGMPQGTPYGLWNNADDDAPDSTREEDVAALESVGYLDGYSALPASTGVVTYDTDRAQPGYNFYTSGHGPEALLTDLAGNELHRWRYELKDIWPDYPVRPDSPKTGYWRRAHLLPDGSVLAIFEGIGIIKLDKDSKPIWSVQNGAHHDLHLNPDGTMWVLTRAIRDIPAISEDKPILEDFVTLMGADGETFKSISLVDATANSPFRDQVWAVMQPWGDIMHTNSIEVLEGRVADELPAFRKGNLLISMLYPNLLAVVDPDAGKLVWTKAGSWKRQHHPTMLDNGNMLVFDNRGNEKASSAIEWNPVTGEEVWRYQGGQDGPFYSYSCGAVYRLDNGNTLIVESDSGRAFEVTPDKEIVWDFYNPARAGDADQYIATLFDLNRVDEAYVSAWRTEP